MNKADYLPLFALEQDRAARPAISYRAARRNAMRKIGNRARVGTGASSYSDRHTRLNTERTLKSMARMGQLPPPTTKEGAYIRALLAQLAPKVGPGKRSIHTLHRKIAIAEQRDYFNRPPLHEAQLVRR